MNEPIANYSDKMMTGRYGIKKELVAFITLVSILALLLLGLLTAISADAQFLSQYFVWLYTVNVVVGILLLLVIVGLVINLTLRLRQGYFGTKLIVKLAMIFGLVGVLPGAILYSVSLQFVGRSIESWFDVNIELALEAGLELGRSTFEISQREFLESGERFRSDYSITTIQKNFELKNLCNKIDADQISIIDQSNHEFFSVNCGHHEIIDTVINTDTFAELNKSGKTSLIKNGIAKALNWPFQFISLGGDSDASTYTGQQLVYESSHCGKIVNSLIASKSMSTVLMFDEIDKISQTPKGEEVMNLLIHLTDPVQNGEFEDKYLAGVPIDLSKVMFVFSANDINKIDKVLLDRMMVIDLKGYDLKQKTAIAEQYLLPLALKDVNLHERIAISKDILTNVIQTYAKEEKGVRELKRSIEQITQKVNMLRLYNSPTLPYHIKDFSLPFTVKEEHVKLFIKKRTSGDTPPPFGMYL
jgi:hypothetical protein